MKKVLIGMGFILALMLVLILGVGLKESGEVKAFDRATVNISEVKDGIYEGCSETTLVKVQVKVTVSDGRLENIEILKHECGKGLMLYHYNANLHIVLFDNRQRDKSEFGILFFLFLLASHENLDGIKGLITDVVLHTTSILGGNLIVNSNIL